MKYLSLMNVILLQPNESGQYHALISKLKEVNPDLKILGLTATPYRLDSGYLTEWDNLF